MDVEESGKSSVLIQISKPRTASEGLSKNLTTGIPSSDDFVRCGSIICNIVFRI